ncbi:hypothetical protein EW146_g3082 [Bondarzewia mesenterica]|uniref:Uncharacterized protein n=1 Tax=Bondarzewia mesenterica TaxID=1095465 RepID=A0A4S4M0Z2_9AGAM|nr:hypothetical protein EW146_g3082 [Bondarzewia mesenterica]
MWIRNRGPNIHRGIAVSASHRYGPNLNLPYGLPARDKPSTKTGHIRDDVIVADESEPSADIPSGPKGILVDIAEDLGLPTTFPLRPAAQAQKDLLEGLPEETGTSTGQGKDYTRKLDRDEVRGVWLALGALAGAWVAGGLLRKESQFAEHAVEEHEAQQHD